MEHIAVSSDLDALIALLRAELLADNPRFRPYAGDDARIGWQNVHIVSEGDNGPVIGFAAADDGSPLTNPELETDQNRGAP